MKKGRITRNIIAIVALAICFVVSFFICKITPSKINNYSDIMGACLSFSSIATALFLSCFSLIPAFSNSKFIATMSELGTDIKLMDRLLVTTIIFFGSSLLSFIELFFNSNSQSLLSRFFTSIWLSVTVSGFVNTFYILIILLKGFELYYQKNKK